MNYFQATSDITHLIESEQLCSFSLINYVSFHDEQKVSDTALSSLPGSHINHVGQQYVSDTAVFLCQAVSSIMFNPTA